MSRQSTEELGVQTPANSDYIKSILAQIKPEYFTSKEKKDSQKSPYECIVGGNYSRIFDTIVSNIKIPDDILQNFVDNAYLYGFEYASALAINPLIESIVDVKNKKLNETFINECIGGTNEYQVLVEKLREHKILSFKNEISETIDHQKAERLFPDFSSMTEEKQKEQLDLYSSEEARKKFDAQFPTKEEFENYANNQIAHGFIDACTVLFTSYLYEKDPTDFKTGFLISNIGKYHQIRNKECAEFLKPYDKQKKYVFGPKMTEEINQIAVETGLTGLNDLIYNPDSDESTYRTRTIELEGNDQLLPKAIALLQFYDLLTLKDESLQILAKNPTLDDETKQDHNLIIDKTTTLIAKYSWNSVECERLTQLIETDLATQKRVFWYSIAAAVITAGAVAVVATFTFGAGLALIPVIYGAIGMAFATALGIGGESLGYFEYQKLSTRITALQVELEKLNSDITDKEKSNFLNDAKTRSLSGLSNGSSDGSLTSNLGLTDHEDDGLSDLSDNFPESPTSNRSSTDENERGSMSSSSTFKRLYEVKIKSGNNVGDTEEKPIPTERSSYVP